MKDERQIKELAKDIGIAFQLAGTTRFGAVAEILSDKWQRKLPENMAVLSKEEYTALINEFNALQHKYDDICDRYRLCKDANETIKQYAVMVRKETEEKYQARIDELEEEVDMLIKEQKEDRSYEIEQSCTERTREILKELSSTKIKICNDYYIFAKNIDVLAKQYGVEVKE